MILSLLGVEFLLESMGHQDESLEKAVRDGQDQGGDRDL